MIQTKNESGFRGFAEAYDDHFREIVAQREVVVERKKLESNRERQPMPGETQARLTGERVWRIVNGQIEELADFVEGPFLDEQGSFERQKAEHAPLLAYIEHGLSACQEILGEINMRQVFRHRRRKASARKRRFGAVV